MRLKKVKFYYLFVVVSVVLSVVIFLFPTYCVARPSCQLAANTLKVVSRIRGLEVRREVPCKLQNKSEVRSYLRETLRTKIPVEKLKAEERVYKFLGFIPEDFNYQNGLLKLYLANLGGYYDPDEEYYGMASWIGEQSQGFIAAHELVHALQDQHFNLDSLLDFEKYTSDALLAHSALAEGDATATMILFGSNLEAASLGKMDTSRFILETEKSLIENESTRDVPVTLAKFLVFPYTDGFRFVRELIDRKGYAEIDKAFKKLPVSTEQILHPEMYIKGVRGYEDIRLPSLTEGQQKIFKRKPVYDDRYGEFFIWTWLGLYLPDEVARQAAKGWGGDRLVFYQENLKADRKVELLFWRSKWDSSLDASEFFNAVKAAFAKRFSSSFATSRKEISFQTKNFGKFSLMLNENQVDLVFGPSPETGPP